MQKSVLQLFAKGAGGDDAFYNKLAGHLESRGLTSNAPRAPKEGCRVVVLDWVDFKPPFENVKNLKPVIWQGKSLEQIEADLLKPGETQLTLGLFDPRLGPVDACMAYLSRHDPDGYIVGETIESGEQAKLEKLMDQVSFRGQVALQVTDIQ